MCTYVIGQGQICLCAILGITLWGSRYVYCGNATTYKLQTDMVVREHCFCGNGMLCRREWGKEYHSIDPDRKYMLTTMNCCRYSA